MTIPKTIFFHLLPRMRMIVPAEAEHFRVICHLEWHTNNAVMVVYDSVIGAELNEQIESIPCKLFIILGFRKSEKCINGHIHTNNFIESLLGKDK